MPGQDLDKQPNYTIKLLNMEPGITQNRSLQNLVDAEEHPDVVVVTNRSIRDVTLRDWITVTILCFINLINYMDRFTLAGILTQIQDYYKITDSDGGLLQTAFILSYMIFAPIFGYLGDRYSRRAIMAFGVFLWSLTTFVGSFMDNFTWFVLFRALVGIGEASYSTIAPTIISDLFVKDVRSKMLAFFYFAIPVGSGLGYIVGSETAKALGAWQWGLRVTPILGAVAVVLIMFVLKDPDRGESEGAHHLCTTSWVEDIKDILKNPSFMLSTLGFTCVAFIAGALAWWGPKFIYLGIKLQPGNEDVQLSDVSYKFGIVAMISGLLGVPAGSFLAQALRERYRNIDPIICGCALLVSAPLVFLTCVTAKASTLTCYFFVFFAEISINLTWSIVADILLYVVVPTRRSSAEGFQLLVSHALGDAGSPYFIGIISDALRVILTSKLQSSSSVPTMTNGTIVAALQDIPSNSSNLIDFKALQYAIFTTCFVEVIGGVFFLITAMYIVKDRLKVEHAVKDVAVPSVSFSGSSSDVPKQF
ncbi:protein spinster isoform X3 [Photinus pyralis]|uniref:Major facilitator superfamily (MFS) profile domain-containing protein n=1 Tax=Photinus pyralis TaxID=7054 RepID=A0A1Y1LAQ8_PHOPY|nr:protein spinster isoform X3 [Photinus pyralis]XP_031353211.1 protein spinster isoform X3 [Photinus pyralis]